MLNKTILQGRITKDIELKVTSSGVEVCSFTLAVERNYCKQGEQRQADFINCVAFKNTAKFLNTYFGKGSQALISGSIQTRTWEKDGVKHYATEVIADEVNFCGDKGQAAQQTQPSDDFAEVEPGDDLPF